MSKTISFTHGTVVKREHNIRKAKSIPKDDHIDESLKYKNVTLIDETIKHAYHRIFDKAVKEYNTKQKRNDRKIDDYYQKIKDDKCKNLAYECIVQIGDKDDTGITSEQEKKALLRYADEWEKRNPNLKLFGVYLHNDEHKGTSHLHIDYIPVAYKNKKGMSIQNSLSKALEEQGFARGSHSHDTAEIRWENSERKALEQICIDMGIDAKANQGITNGRNHLPKPEYEKIKDKVLSNLQQQKEQLQQEIADYQPPKKILGELSSHYQQRVQTHQESQNIIKNKEELEKLQQQLLQQQQQQQQMQHNIDRQLQDAYNKGKNDQKQADKELIDKLQADKQRLIQGQQTAYDMAFEKGKQQQAETDKKTIDRYKQQVSDLNQIIDNAEQIIQRDYDTDMLIEDFISAKQDFERS